VVGNLLIPVAGVSFVHVELLWFFFSIGIIFWLVLMTIIMYRVFFHEPLVSKLMPTLFILIAPPSVGVISYFKLTQSVDSFSRVLYYFAFFIALLLILNMRMFMSKKFYLSQWAFTFPLAAFSIASALMFHQVKIEAFLYVHLIFVVLSAGIIAFLVYRTGKAMLLHEICQED
jgi:tellurite resistance protein